MLGVTYLKYVNFVHKFDYLVDGLDLLKREELISQSFVPTIKLRIIITCE